MNYTYEKDAIKCPICGYLQTDELFFDDGCHEWECPRCCNTFDLTVYTSISYTIERRDAE